MYAQLPIPDRTSSELPSPSPGWINFAQNGCQPLRRLRAADLNDAALAGTTRNDDLHHIIA
jgi:hypothetical protein